MSERSSNPAITPLDHELLNGHLDGMLSDAQCAQLRQRLHASPALLAELAAAVEVEQQLISLISEARATDRGEWLMLMSALDSGQHLHPVELPERTAYESDPSARENSADSENDGVRILVIPRLVWWGGIAALVVLAGLLLTMVLPGGGAGPVAPVDDKAAADARAFAATTVASLVWASPDLAAADGAATPARGDRLVPGAYRFVAGEALVKFDNGAEAILTAPVSLQILSQNTTSLELGTLHAEVPASGHGFKVLVPGGVVTDLGTAFSVHVDPIAALSQIEVFSGLVQVDTNVPGQPNQSVRLRADQFARLTAKGNSLLAYEKRPERGDLGWRSMGIAPPGAAVLDHLDADPAWEIILEDGTSQPAYVIAPVAVDQTNSDLRWLDSDARTSQWLSPSSDGDRLGEFTADYIFQTTVDIDESFDLSTIDFSARFIADNQLMAVNINGVKVAGPFSIPADEAESTSIKARFREWQPIEIANVGRYFEHGQNQIQFVLRNTAGHGGLRVEMRASAIRAYVPINDRSRP